MSTISHFNSSVNLYKMETERRIIPCKCRKVESCDHLDGELVTTFVRVTQQEAMELRQMGREVYYKSGMQYSLYSEENPRETDTRIADRSSSYTTSSDKCRYCFSRKQCNCEN